MEINQYSNLISFLNKKVRVTTEINSVYIGKLFFVDKNKNLKLANCKEYIELFGIHQFNGFFKNVYFNGDKKVTINLESKCTPLSAADTSISSMAYSRKKPSTSQNIIQGNRRVEPLDVALPNVTKESSSRPPFYNLGESSSTGRIVEGNHRIRLPETFTRDLPKQFNTKSMFGDPEEMSLSQGINRGNQSNESTDLNGRTVWDDPSVMSNTSRRSFQGNQRVKAPEMLLNVATQELNPGSFFYGSEGSRSFQGNQSIRSPEIFPHGATREMNAESMFCYSHDLNTSRGILEGNQWCGHPENFPRDATNTLNVGSMLGDAKETIISQRTIQQGDPNVESLTMLHDVTNNVHAESMFYNPEYAGGFQGNQNVGTQETFLSDTTRRLEAFSLLCEREMPNAPQRSMQGEVFEILPCVRSWNGTTDLDGPLQFSAYQAPARSTGNINENARFESGVENINWGLEGSVISHIQQPSAAQNLEVFPNMERQNFVNGGSHNLSNMSVATRSSPFKLMFIQEI